MAQQQQPEREREVIVTDRGGGMGTGVVIGVILAVIALVFVGWLVFFSGGEDTSPIDVPTEVDVNIDNGGAEGGGDAGEGS